MIVLVDCSKGRLIATPKLDCRVAPWDDHPAFLLDQLGEPPGLLVLRVPLLRASRPENAHLGNTLILLEDLERIPQFAQREIENLDVTSVRPVRGQAANGHHHLRQQIGVLAGRKVIQELLNRLGPIAAPLLGRARRRRLFMHTLNSSRWTACGDSPRTASL